MERSLSWLHAATSDEGVDAIDKLEVSGGGANVVCGSSASAVDGDFECFADFAHTLVAESAEAFDQRPDRNALDRIEVDDRDERDRVVRGLEEDLRRDTADCGCARPDQGAPQSRDRRVSGEHHYRPAPDLWKLAPPNIASRRKRSHDAPAGARNEARSPHASASSSGCLSYAT